MSHEFDSFEARATETEVMVQQLILRVENTEQQLRKQNNSVRNKPQSIFFCFGDFLNCVEII